MSEEIIKLAVRNNCEHQSSQYGYVQIKRITNEIIKLVRLSEERITNVRNIIENEIIIFALKNNLWSENINIIKLAIQNNSKFLEICMLAVQNNYKALGYIPIEKLSDEISKLAVQNNYKALKYIPKNKKSDEIIKIAVQNNSKALRYIPKEKMSIEIIKLALKNNGYVIIHVPIEKMSEEIIKLALENNSYILLHIPESKITDDIINFVIEKDGYNILQYLPIEKMPLDPITFEPIHKDRAILIHKQLYDAKSLYKYIKSNINASIPHNREPFTEEMLLDIYNKSNYV